jgi:hypothetical protein
MPCLTPILASDVSPAIAQWHLLAPLLTQDDLCARSALAHRAVGRSRTALRIGDGSRGSLRNDNRISRRRLKRSTRERGRKPLQNEAASPYREHRWTNHDRFWIAGTGPDEVGPSTSSSSGRGSRACPWSGLQSVAESSEGSKRRKIAKRRKLMCR